MAYCIERGERLVAGLRRIAAEQFDELLAVLDDGELGVDEQVHRARKQVKRIRGLLRLGRTGAPATFRAENAALRDAARRLSPARDAAIRLSTLQELEQRVQRGAGVGNAVLADVRRLLETRRAAATESAEGRTALDGFRAAIQEAAARSERWRTKGDEGQVIREGFRRTYAAARAAYSTAAENGDAEAFHRWRRRVKEHGCHLALLAELWPAVVASHGRRVEKLAGLLGRANDWAVLMDELPRLREAGVDSAAIERLMGASAVRQERLQARAQELGAELFAEQPRRFARPISRLWRR